MVDQWGQKHVAVDFLKHYCSCNKLCVFICLHCNNLSPRTATLANVSVVRGVNSLHFLLSSNNNSDSKCDNYEDFVALKSHLQEALSELKSVQLLIKLLQEKCNKKEEIKPNDVNNLTNSDRNTSEIISGIL